MLPLELCFGKALVPQLDVPPRASDDVVLAADQFQLVFEPLQNWCVDRAVFHNAERHGVDGLE